MAATPTARNNMLKISDFTRLGKDTYSPEEIAVIRRTHQSLAELLRVAKWRMPSGRRPDAARKLLLDIADRVSQAFDELQRERV